MMKKLFFLKNNLESDVLVNCIFSLLAWLAFFLVVRKWYSLPPEDGDFGQIALRLLNGEILFSEVQSFAPGYIHWFHSSLFYILGPSFLTLRWGIFIAVSLQIIAICLLLRTEKSKIRYLACVALVFLGPCLFFVPQRSIYCLAFYFLAMVIFSARGNMNQKVVYGSIGLLLGLTFWSRPSSGIFFTIIFLSVIGLNSSSGKTTLSATQLLFRAVVLTPYIGYIFAYSDISAALLFGVPLLIVFLFLLFHSSFENFAEIIRHMLWIFTGAIISSLPHIVYNSYFHVWTDFFNQSFVAAIKEPHTFPHYKNWSYFNLVLEGAVGIHSFGTAISAIFWIIIIFLPWIVLATLFYSNFCGKLRRRHIEITFFSLAHAPVALTAQLVEILSFTSSLMVIAIITTSSGISFRAQNVVLLFCSFLLMISITFTSFRPYTASPLSERSSWPSVSLMSQSLSLVKIPSNQVVLYDKLGDAIKKETSKDSRLLSIPWHPEINFLYELRNPSKYIVSAYACLNPLWIEDFKQQIKYHTDLIVLERNGHFMEDCMVDMIPFIEEDFYKVAEIETFEVFKAKSPANPL
jgi:hypothetical protein